MDKSNHVTKKITHGGRKAGAQHAQSNGASIEEIAQHGNWNNRRLVTSYLENVPKEIPYRLAGFKLPNEDHWLERNTLTPPLALQKQIFPFVEELFPGDHDWARLIENIMLDNPDDTDRLEAHRITIPKQLIPAWRLMITLAHLRKVVLQDAAALMLIVEGQCMYSQHHIFTKINECLFNARVSRIHISTTAEHERCKVAAD